MGTNAYTYAYDPIGNREWARMNADTNTYSANALNQYSCITNSAYSASSRETIPAYDPDGNMITNGVWVYTWDGENRLASAVSNGVLMVTNVYDHLSRRFRKEVYVRESPSFEFQVSRCHTFLYDGWNVIREVRSQSSEISTNYYTWGLDLSGTQQGAGGVGGLLAVTSFSSDTSYLSPLTYYPAYDANGNIVQYFDSTGGVAMAFCYDAFGSTISETGNAVPGTVHLPHRFSTKYLDAETGLYYYGWRFYHPDLGRWVSMDPIEEKGGVNLYCFLTGNPLDNIDPVGWKLFIVVGDDYEKTSVDLRSQHELLKRQIEKVEKAADRYKNYTFYWDDKEVSYSEFKRRLQYEKEIVIKSSPFTTWGADKVVLEATKASQRESWDQTAYIHHGTRVLDGDAIRGYVVQYTEAPQTPLDKVSKEVASMGITHVSCFVNTETRATRAPQIVWPEGRLITLTDYNAVTKKLEQTTVKRHWDEVECWVAWGGARLKVIEKEPVSRQAGRQ